MYTGGCLCGAVTFEFSGPVEETYNCHCSRCRRLHSAGYVTLTMLPHSRFRLLTGREDLAFCPSSDDEHRAFCGTCGSHLFAEAIDPRQREDIYVSVANVLEPHDLKPEFHIFADSSVSWITMDERLQLYSGPGGEGSGEPGAQ